MKNKANNKRLKLEPRTTQKLTMRYKVIASSILGMMAVSFIYLNFSQSEVSKADDKNKDNKITYRTTDIVVPQRMLLDATSIERTTSVENKTNPQNKMAVASRASDIFLANEQ